MNGLLYGGICNVSLGVYMLMTYYSQSGKYMLTSNEAKKLIQSEKIDHIIDVRTEVEWDTGHYPNAIHIPRHKLSKNALKNAGIKNGDIILVYCNTGQRARLASETITKMGYETYYITSSYNSLI
jgi:rhodanese-related sulfurtransferase